MWSLTTVGDSVPPARPGGTPWLSTLLLVKKTGVSQVVVDIFKIETKLYSCSLMIAFIDLHYPGVGGINLSS